MRKSYSHTDIENINLLDCIFLSYLELSFAEKRIEYDCLE